jgi:phthiodiolone/phenolphthiodiolone dimycocerosates ketoreductase
MVGVRYGVALASSVQEMVRTATLAEKLGYDSIWMPDETKGYEMEYEPEVVIPDCITCLTVVALRTKRLLIGTCVIDALARHPAKMAQAVATLDSTAKGRILAGVGASESGNHEPFGIPTDHPYGRLRETMQVSKLLWKSSYENRMDFSGDYYHLDDAFLRIRPTRSGGPPMYVAAYGPKMLALVGELGDGWIPFAHTPESYKDRLNGPIRQSLEQAGRSAKEIEPTCIFPTAISKDGIKAQQDAIRIAKAYLVWSIDNTRLLIPDLANEHPGIRQTQLKNRENINKLIKLARKIPDEIALETTISGTSSDCENQVSRFIRAGCRHLIFVFAAKNERHRDSMMKLFAKVI